MVLIRNWITKLVLKKLDKSLSFKFPFLIQEQFEMQKDLKVNGESMASNRKNKLIAYWDYSFEAKFKLKHKGNEVECKCFFFSRVSMNTLFSKGDDKMS